MPPRFHIPDLESNGRGVLADEEARHLTRVLRLGVGDEVDVFDGRGGMFRARVVEVGRTRVQVQVQSPVSSAPEPQVRVTLVMSVLKGDGMDDVVRDAVMMGVHAVQPVVSARSEVSVATLVRGHRTERWQRVAIASVKQCGRSVVPLVYPPRVLHDWMAEASGVVLALHEPSAGPAAALRDVRPAGAVCLLVGPEGGWSLDEQVAFASRGFRAVALGGRTLRAATTPLVALAALYEAWGAW